MVNLFIRIQCEQTNLIYQTKTVHVKGNGYNITWNDKFMLDTFDDEAITSAYTVQLYDAGLFFDKLIGQSILIVSAFDTETPDLELDTSSITKLLLLQNPETNVHVASLSIDLKIHSVNSEMEITEISDITLENWLFSPVTQINMVVYLSMAFLLFIVFNASVMMYLEHDWDPITAVWFTIVTVTTVGYGDFYPQTNVGLLVNCMTIIISTLAIGCIFSHAMNCLFLYDDHAKKQQKIKNNVCRLKRLPSVESDDLANDVEDNDIINGMKLRKQALIKTLMINSIIITVIIFIGSLFFYVYESRDNYIEALHLVFVTMSTVGYGDDHPKSLIGKMVATLYIFIGVAIVGLFATLITDYIRQQHHDTQIIRTLNNTLLNKTDINKFDLNGDGTVSKFEFLCTMLVVSNETSYCVIRRIMKKFHELDKDNNERISIGDLKARFMNC